jgi:hypothetical protein
MIANTRMSFTVMYAWNGILSLFFLALMGCWILFGVEIVSGLGLLLRFRMVLGSGARKIVFVLHYIRQTLLTLIELIPFLCMGLQIVGF